MMRSTYLQKLQNIMITTAEIFKGRYALLLLLKDYLEENRLDVIEEYGCMIKAT